MKKTIIFFPLIICFNLFTHFTKRRGGRFIISPLNIDLNDGSDNTFYASHTINKAFFVPIITVIVIMIFTVIDCVGNFIGLIMKQPGLHCCNHFVL